MDSKKLFTGAFAGGIVVFFLGWFLYGNLLAGFMWHNCGKVGHIIYRKELDFTFLAAGCFLKAALLSYVIVKSKVTSLMGGVITGAVVGFLMTASMDFISYGNTLIMSKRGIAADVLAFTLLAAIAGAVIVAVTGPKFFRQ